MKFYKSYIKRTSFNRHPKAKFLLWGGLLFSLGMVTSVASTYAWYSITALTSIKDLNVRISSEGKDYWLTVDLENKNGEKYYHDDHPNGYTLAEMGYDAKEGLHDVSGMWQEDWYEDADPNVSFPEFKSNYGSFPAAYNHSTVAKTGFLQTTLWLKANQNCEIYLTPESGIFSADNEESAYAKKKDLQDLLNVTNTVRLSFYSEDGYIIAKTGVSKDTVYGGVLDMNGDGFYDSIDGKEVLYGQYNTHKNLEYGEVAPSSNEPYREKDHSTFKANHQAGIQQVIYDENDPELGMVKEDSVKLEALQYDEHKPLRPRVPICKVKAGEKKRVVFSVYCEGWDEYMTDATESASLNINIALVALIKD